MSKCALSDNSLDSVLIRRISFYLCIIVKFEIMEERYSLKSSSAISTYDTFLDQCMMKIHSYISGLL